MSDFDHRFHADPVTRQERLGSQATTMVGDTFDAMVTPLGAPDARKTDLEAAAGGKSVDEENSGKQEQQSSTPAASGEDVEKGQPASSDAADELAAAPAATQKDEVITYPEGGLRAWLVAFGGFWCMWWSFGNINTFGVFQQYYSVTMLSDRSQSEIAWIGSFQYFLVFLIGLFGGRAFDLGLFKPVIAFGIALWVVCQMLLSLCTQYWQLFLCQGLGLGLAQGILFNLAVSLPTHWFQRRRAFALGIQASGSSLGGAVLPIMANRLLGQIGYPWTMRIFGFMGLVTLTGSYFIMNTRIAPIATVHNGGWRRIQWFDFSSLRILSFDLFALGAAIIFLGLYNPFSYMDIFTTQYAVPASGYYLSILNAASTFGRIVPGYFADRVGRFNMAVPHLAAASVLLFIFPLCTKIGGLVPFSILFGFTSGLYVSIVPACLAQLGPIQTLGTRNGLAFAIISFSGLVGTPIGGVLLGEPVETMPGAPPTYAGWWRIMAFSGAVATVGTGLILASRQVATKGRVWVKF